MSPAIPVQRSGNPVLDEIDQAHQNLSPQAQHAIRTAAEPLQPKPFSPLIPEAPIPTPGGAPPTAEPPAPAQSGAIPIPNSMTAGAPAALPGAIPLPTTATQAPSRPPPAHIPVPANPNLQPAQNELARITVGPQAKSGISQIKSPYARIPLQILDALGTGVAPGITSAIPGTQLHHQALVGQAEQSVKSQEGQQDEAVKRAQEEAQTANLESQPELNQAKSELAASKQNETAAHHQSQIDVAREKDTATATAHEATLNANLRTHGYKKDPQGNIVPLAYEEMSPEQQSVHDLKASQQELADAHAALAKAQQENIPKAAELAKARIATAQQNANTAAGRLGLSQKQYEAEYHGTDNGVPLSGIDADEAGNPVGTKVSAAGKVGGAVGNRAAQGTTIKEAGDQLIKEIDAKKNVTGNLESYWKQGVNGTPIADPQASGLITSLASFAALQPALHGFRSHDALREFAKIIGGIPKDPEALKESIRSIQRTAGIVEKSGQHKKVTPQGAGNAPEIKTKEEFDKLPSGSEYMEDGHRFKKP